MLGKTLKIKTMLLIIFLDTLLIISSIRSDNIVQELQQINFIDFLTELFANENFGCCSLHFFKLQIDHSMSNPIMNDLWTESDNVVTSTVQKTINTNGILITEVRKGVSLHDSSGIYQQSQKISHSKRCSVVVINILNPLFTTVEDNMMRNQISPNSLYPPTVRNRDKYLILTRQNRVDNVKKSMFIKTLKFKLILVLNDSQGSVSTFSWNHANYHFQVKVLRLCHYGLCNLKVLNKQLKFKNAASEINSLFPDQERNFFGHNLRLSTTIKIPQVLEVNIEEDENGKDVFIPKRGLYVSVLKELSTRLNFTYRIVPSSGGGSTGHALQNGTWVGTVGDVYKGNVDFGVLAAVTFQRFPYAEFCAPVNFAYLGYVTGSPRKSFSWKAILWPFSKIIWLGLVEAILLASILLVIFANLPLNFNCFKKVWEYLKAAFYLIRILLEQCPGVPSNGTSISFRTFLISWLMFSLVISAAYKCKMVSLLTFPTFGHIPEDFDELASAKDFEIDFHYFGNVGYTYFKTSKNPSYMTIYRRMEREPNPLTCIERTLKGKSACIIFSLTFKQLLHGNLSDRYGNSPLKFARDEGAMFAAGVIYQHKAPLSTNFKSVLLPAMETGIIPFWEQSDLNKVLENKNHWQRINNITVTWDNGNDSILHVRNLQGAFVILFVGAIAATFAFLVENTKRIVSLICLKTRINSGEHLIM